MPFAIEVDRILHRYDIVIPCREQEDGASLLIHMVDRRRHARLAHVRDLLRQRRITKYGRIGAVPSHGGGAGSQMAACREADHRDLLGMDVPFLRLVPDQFHGLLVIFERIGPCLMLARGIAEDERLIPRFQIGVATTSASRSEQKA